MEVNRKLYDKVTAPWQLILGENFHYGYFSEEEESLENATINLIENLAKYAPITNRSRILDVGCGICEPAIYLNKKFNCSVTGVTISPKGAEAANIKIEKAAVSDYVTCLVQDALNLEFQDLSFNIAWVMESSHLIRDKKKLLKEVFRVLGNDSYFLLCDLTLKNKIDMKYIVENLSDFKLLERSFGSAKMEPTDFYVTELDKLGFINIKVVDISQNVYPTLTHWKSNMISKKQDILKHFTFNEYKEFLESCDILLGLFKSNIMGYSIIKAEKK